MRQEPHARVERGDWSESMIEKVYPLDEALVDALEAFSVQIDEVPLSSGTRCLIRDPFRTVSLAQVAFDPDPTDGDRVVVIVLFSGGSERSWSVKRDDILAVEPRGQTGGLLLRQR